MSLNFNDVSSSVEFHAVSKLFPDEVLIIAVFSLGKNVCRPNVQLLKFLKFKLLHSDTDMLLMI